MKIIIHRPPMAPFEHQVPENFDVTVSDYIEFQKEFYVFNGFVDGKVPVYEIMNQPVFVG